ncbi:MAG: hypothetical protein EXR05_05130 [Acetobacteraceae bacterium]|nr:hypothetical protein [Acetobacteraceae bacterium]MSP31016.1 hypothetical protein [Acetobacteraceae bacterium]
MIRVLVLLVLFLPAKILAESHADIAAQRAGTLFVQGCVHYADNAAGLRVWAGKIGLPALPELGQAGFLKGAVRVTYDASNPARKYVVIGIDDGGCMVLAETVNTGELVPASEVELAGAGIPTALDGDPADVGTDGMRHRTYHAAQGQRGWAIVIGHSPDMPDQVLLSDNAR